MTHSITLLAGVAFTVCLLVFICGCGSGDASENTKKTPGEGQQKFASYWQTGEGELSSYQLEQSRNGEIRTGEAIMAFAVEDFSKEKLVRLDKPDEAGTDRLPVLKFNLIKRFGAGAYDFSMMQSTFTPIGAASPFSSIKSTASSQDWGGQSFVQLKLKEDRVFTLELRSHLEAEGDKQAEIRADLLEDEIWNRIRINPGALPEGEADLIPGSLFSIFQHQPIRPRKARLRLDRDGTSALYIVEYLHLDRTLTISFDPEFPHRILSWIEMDGGKISSRATLQRTIMDAFWLHDQNQYDHLRDSLLMR